jgi:putative IMPACT (imprinted ancient) family translation regulator
VLHQNGVENTLCAVVRYFGGVLLGTGGLVRAYGKAASTALENAGMLDVRVCRTMEIQTSYASYAILEPLLQRLKIPFEAEFAGDVKLTCTVLSEEADAFSSTVIDKTYGKADVRPLELKLCAL